MTNKFADINNFPSRWEANDMNKHQNFFIDPRELEKSVAKLMTLG